MTPIKRLLLATDFSDWARRAEHYACSLAASWQIPLTIMTVLEFPPGMDPEYALNKHYLTERMDEASFRLADFKSRAILRGIEATTRIATGIPSDEVIAAARAEDSDLLIVGTRGSSGLAHVLLGSTAERVIRTAPCPVLAVRTPDGDVSVEQGISLHRILAPTDFSKCSLEALEYAATVAMQAKASIELLHVLEPVSYGIDFTLGDTQEREQRRRRMSEGLESVAADLSEGRNSSQHAPPRRRTCHDHSRGGADLVKRSHRHGHAWPSGAFPPGCGKRDRSGVATGPVRRAGREDA